MADQKWFQQVLLADEVSELRVRVGWIPSRDHVQWQIELVDPTTDRLIDMWSTPHRTFERYETWLPEFIGQLRSILDGIVEPF